MNCHEPGLHGVKEGDATSAADHALALSEQRLRLAQAVAQIGAWELQPEAGAIHFSPESCELFGLTGNATTNLYQQWLSRIDPRDRHAIHDLIEQCNVSATAETEYRYRHPARGVRWIHCRAGRVGDRVP